MADTGAPIASPEWVAPAWVLTVVFNGQPTEVRRKGTRLRTVREIMAKAAKQTGNDSYFLGKEHLWECRDGIGRLLSPFEVVPNLHWDCADLIYVNLRPGVGA
jgi:hypothetical protein